MNKQWPVLAQILIALGCGGGIVSMWAGFSQHNWMVVAFGMMSLFLFWSFYQMRLWAQRAVSIFLGALLVSDVVTVVMGLVQILPGVLVVMFRGLILYYLNTKEIKAVFESNQEVSKEV